MALSRWRSLAPGPLPRTNPRRRVLVLTKTSALGGAERLLMNALPHLDREAFDYRFAALDGDGPLAAACHEAELPFSTLPHPRALDPRNVLALRRLLRTEGIDLVHVHLPLTATLARTAARGLATRIVYTEHSVQQNYRAPSRWLNAATYGWQHRVVAVSREVRSSAERQIGSAARDRTAVVTNGVDFERLDREAAMLPGAPLPALPRSAFRILVPASLTPAKGHEVLLQAIDALDTRPFPPLAVWLAGEGPRRRALEDQIRRRGLGDRVRLLGRRDDIFPLMAQAHAVVLPSRHEGHPLALLEALSLGRPVVATRVGGVPEIVAHRQTGLLVPPEDPTALAEAIDELRRDPGLRNLLGVNAARDARRRFDVRRGVAAIETIYRGCLDARDRAMGRPQPPSDPGPRPHGPGIRPAA